MPNQPSSRELRKGRASLPGQLYMVTAVTHARVAWFADFGVACLAAKTLCQATTWPDAKWLAWVLMPDHMHLLIELGDRESLSLVMQRVKALISGALRSQLATLPLWQSGFHDHALRREQSMREVARYLIANPLRAGLVEHIGDYPFWAAAWLEPGCDPLDP